MIQITEEQWIGAAILIEAMLIADFEEGWLQEDEPSQADFYNFVDTVLPIKTLELIEDFFDIGFGKGNWEY